MRRRAPGSDEAVTSRERREAERRIGGCLKGRTGRERERCTAKDRQMKRMRRETTDGRKTTNRPTKHAAVTCRLLLRF